MLAYYYKKQEEQKVQDFQCSSFPLKYKRILQVQRSMLILPVSNALMEVLCFLNMCVTCRG